MIFTPDNIVKVLTAAAPIVASLAAMNKSEDTKAIPEKNVSITINNTFYTKSERDSVEAANQIHSQIANVFNTDSGIRYTL